MKEWTVQPRALRRKAICFFGSSPLHIFDPKCLRERRRRMRGVGRRMVDRLGEEKTKSIVSMLPAMGVVTALA